MWRWKQLLAERVPAVRRQLLRAARLAIGIPDYDVYVAHMRASHPQSQPMSRAAFFTERLHARYAKGRNRCC